MIKVKDSFAKEPKTLIKKLKKIEEMEGYPTFSGLEE